MASFKIALLVLLAFGAVQCHSAAVVEPEPRELDVLLAAQQVIKIVRNVVGAIEKGIQESKPCLDMLIQQLTPEVGVVIKDLVNKILGMVKDEKTRIEFMIKEFEGLLNAIKKIRVCSDPVKKDLEKTLAKLEIGLLGAVRESIKANKDDLNDIKTGFERILKKFRTLYDTEITALTGCIKPGHPNAQKCINDEVAKIKKAVVGLAAEVLLFVDEAQDVLKNFALKTLEKVQPFLTQFEKDVDPIMKKISDCIAKMK
ncbi:UNVERIFIED_CONTAM: hypothetical protein PYX00_009324 [Menopon gallinae]|uniref:Uncharacterized protein n=1 Tax=Menopon gallinae TaxID=328185 RepID=A0AAW2HB63_9NEOP